MILLCLITLLLCNWRATRTGYFRYQEGQKSGQVVGVKLDWAGLRSKEEKHTGSVGQNSQYMRTVKGGRQY